MKVVSEAEERWGGEMDKDIDGGVEGEMRLVST